MVSDRCEPLRVAGDAISDEGTYFLLRAGAATGGYTSMTSADTAVSVAFSLVRKAIADPTVDPGFTAGTLADGSSGQLLTIEITEVAGVGTWTLTPTTATGFTSLVFEAAGDIVTLLYVDDSVGWILISQESVQKEL